MLYPDVDRVSPARIAKSLPVIPSVEPPLSVYLAKGVSLGGKRVEMPVLGSSELTGRSHVVGVLMPRWVLLCLRRSSSVGPRR